MGGNQLSARRHQHEGGRKAIDRFVGRLLTPFSMRCTFWIRFTGQVCKMHPVTNDVLRASGLIFAASWEIAC